MAGDTPIYDVSRKCDRLFAEIINDPYSASILVTETVYLKFTQWVRYLGVYASKSTSLDTRLRYSQSLNDLVLQYLDIAYRNLGRVKRLELNRMHKEDGCLVEAAQESIAKEIDPASELDAASPLTESLQALRAAIDGLYRLGIAIRQSSSSTLNQRISNFAHENDDMSIEDCVFFRLKVKFFEQTQEGTFRTPLSLYKQLAISISSRYFGLLYRLERQKVLEKDRELVQDDAPTEESAVDVNPGKIAAPRKVDHTKRNGADDLRRLAGANAFKKKRDQKPVGAPTTVNSKEIFQKLATSNKSYSAPLSTYSARADNTEYPRPPRIDSDTKAARCPFCQGPILQTELEKKNWWHDHLKGDLQLYTCLSEACAEPPQRFAHFEEWSKHMDEYHSMSWIEEIHQPTGWVCDIGHEDEHFISENEYDEHLQKLHPEYEDERTDLKTWSEFQVKRPTNTCPICNCIPDEVTALLRKPPSVSAETTEGASQAKIETKDTARTKLLIHIGAHLKNFGLMSINYLNDSDGDAKNSAIHEDGKMDLEVTPPEYFDLQYSTPIDLLVPDEVQEKEEWPEAVLFPNDEDSVTAEREDPLQRFMSHQRAPRLLKTLANGSLSFTTFAHDEVPNYAILSHTWFASEDEVSFQDVIAAIESGVNDYEFKFGFENILFCAEQAKSDGLEYFWVDTCCIDRSNHAELEIAINSMFDWYQHAAKCYVILSDTNDESDIARSRWFTRSWTLQELLAPKVVEFFSRTGTKFGNKNDLSEPLHEITGVPVSALQGEPLSNFSIQERLSWGNDRECKIEEDRVYALLGICEIEMPLQYGEGAQKAMERLLNMLPGVHEGLTDQPQHTLPSTQEPLLERIRRSMSTSNFARVRGPQAYVSQSQISELVTESAIRSELGKLGTTSMRDLATWIHSNARRLFTIVVLCEFHIAHLVSAMSIFRQHDLTDDQILPVSDNTSRPDGFSSEIWSERDLIEFCQKQWQVLVPVFGPDRFDYDLASDCILPFTLVETASRTGAFSTVNCIRIHDAHNKHINLGNVALKELLVRESEEDFGVDETWDNETRALRAVNKLQNPHLIECIAAIRHGNSRYLMFPWADGNNLRDYWNQHPKVALSHDVIKQVIRQLRGLADALVSLHNYNDWPRRIYSEDDVIQITGRSTTNRPATVFESDGEDSSSYVNIRHGDFKPGIIPRYNTDGDGLGVLKIADFGLGKQYVSVTADNSAKHDAEDLPSEVYTRHGDLKPENILVFNSDGDGLGVLKIADFGLAKQHVSTLADKSAKHDPVYTTRLYEPPETATNTFVQTRLYDIWSMGCITLEVIIWILYGNEHLEDFHEQLGGNDVDSYQFYQIRVQDEPDLAEVHSVVRRWIAHIHEQDPECKQDSAIKDLLRIVEQKLLVVALPGGDVSSGSGGSQMPPLHHSERPRKFRATAQEFRDSLDDILRKSAQDKYLWTENDRSNAQPPTASSAQTRTELASLMTGEQGGPARADYSLPPLRDWDFQIDNHLPRSLAEKFGNAAFLPKSNAKSRLCDRCSQLQIWTGGFYLEDTVTNLGRTMPKCDFCKMLHDAVAKEGDLIHDRVMFERRKSNLYLTGRPHPVLSIFVPQEGKLMMPFQLGFTELPNPDTDMFFAVLNTWLADCNKGHSTGRVQSCVGVTKDRLPTRLLDVGIIEDSTLRLIDTQSEYLGLGEEYVALSFTWGLIRPPVATKGNYAELSSAIPLEDLPATFRDAVVCTRKLNIRYLWIDALCILQDDANDWREEASRMESVFQGASCVLSATRAAHSHDGFLKPRRSREHVTFTLEDDQPVYVCEAIDDFNNDVVEAPLYKRGWTFQERALARRTIYFTETQVYFECGDGVRCETMTRMHSRMTSLLGDPRFPERITRASYIQELYKHYSRLQFARDTDRPHAIAGLEKSLYSALKIQGHFGIFGDQADRASMSVGMLRRSLLWKRCEEDEPASDQDTTNWLRPIEFPPDSPVPTWSWMAYMGEIDYVDLPFSSAGWERDDLDFWDGTSVHFSAMVRDYSVAGRMPGDCYLTFDQDRSAVMVKQRASCVIIARRKEPQAQKSKRTYVLLVTEVQGKSELGRKLYRRAGVGFMLDKFIALEAPGTPAYIV